jgi:hypothetical protein
MIDAGKTMRETCLRLFPQHRVQSVDALLLTHGHADAIFGLDDMRDLQDPRAADATPVFLSAATYADVRARFAYLVPGAGSSMDAERAAHGKGRTVSRLDWTVIEPGPFSLHGVTFHAIPVRPSPPAPLPHSPRLFAAAAASLPGAALSSSPEAGCDPRCCTAGSTSAWGLISGDPTGGAWCISAT